MKPKSLLLGEDRHVLQGAGSAFPGRIQVSAPISTGTGLGSSTVFATHGYKGAFWTNHGGRNMPTTPEVSFGVTCSLSPSWPDSHFLRGITPSECLRACPSSTCLQAAHKLSLDSALRDPGKS